MYRKRAEEIVAAAEEVFSNPLSYQITNQYSNGAGGYCYIGAVRAKLGDDICSELDGNIFPFGNQKSEWRMITNWNDLDHLTWQEISERILNLLVGY